MKQARRLALDGKPPRKSTCMPCRSRRIRCNKAIPCNNCLIRGVHCESVSSYMSSHAPRTASSTTEWPGFSCSNSHSVDLVISSPGNNRRKEGFHSFLTVLDGYIKSLKYPHPVYLWRHGIIPAAQSNEALMSAILCKEIINKMSKEQLMSAALPEKAVEYYVESLCRPFSRFEDLPLLLMITVIYIEVEWMLSHYKNMDLLIRSEIEILYMNAKILRTRYRRNTLFFVILVEFLRLCHDVPNDSSSISLEAWGEVYNLTTELGMYSNADELLFLELRMYDLCFRMQRPDFDDSNFAWKFITWEHNLNQYERGLKPMQQNRDEKRIQHMKSRFLVPKIFWNSYQFYKYGNEFYGQVLQATVELQTQKIEALAQQNWVQHMSDSPLMNGQVSLYIIPQLALLVHCWRDRPMCQRNCRALLSFRPWITWYDDLVEYLESIAQTKFGYHTPLEVAYLGPGLPPMLKKWQITRVVDQIATHGAIELLRNRNYPLSLVNFIT